MRCVHAGVCSQRRLSLALSRDPLASLFAASCGYFPSKVVVGASVERSSSRPRLSSSHPRSPNRTAGSPGTLPLPPGAIAAMSSRVADGRAVFTAGPDGVADGFADGFADGVADGSGGGPCAPLLSAEGVASGANRAATLELLWRLFLGATLAALPKASPPGAAAAATATAAGAASLPKGGPLTRCLPSGGGEATFVTEEYSLLEGDTVTKGLRGDVRRQRAGVCSSKLLAYTDLFRRSAKAFCF